MMEMEKNGGSSLSTDIKLSQRLHARQRSRHMLRPTCGSALLLPQVYFSCSFSVRTCCVFVCFSHSTASGCSLSQSFNSKYRLFVWVRPYKHTIRPALCTEDYSWHWPQFSSGLLPGSQEVPSGKPQPYQNQVRSGPQHTARPPQ